MLEALRTLIQGDIERNAFYLILGSVISTILGFVYRIFAGRLFPIDEYGIAVSIIALMNLVHLFSLGGIDTSLGHFLPNSKDPAKTIATSLSSIILSSILMSSIFLVVLRLVDSPIDEFFEDPIKMILLFIGTILMGITAVQFYSYIGLRNTRRSLLQVAAPIFRLASLPFMVVFLANGFLGSFIFGLIALSLINGYLLSVETGGKILTLAFDREYIKRMYQFSFGTYLSKLVGLVPEYIMPILVVAVLGEVAAAQFNVAWIFSYPLLMVARMVVGSLLAESSFSLENSQELSRRAIALILKINIPGSLLLFLLLFLAPLFLGNEYFTQNTGLLVLLFALSSIPFAYLKIISTRLMVDHAIRNLIILNTSIALITLILQVLLLGQFGLIGIAFAWLLGNSITLLGYSLIRQLN